jgi:hypothetical protein
MDDPVYKKPIAKPPPSPVLPSLEEVLEKQCTELIELAQVRYGIKGGAVDVRLTPVLIHDRMSENQIFTELSTAPDHERADCVLYALAKGDISAPLANRLLSALRLIAGMKSRLTLS